MVKLQTALHEHIHNLDDLVNERTAQLEKLLEEIRHLSVTDGLTGCYNRRALQDKLPEEIERAQRYHRPLAVVFMDIDHFKQFNDQHGHQLGDEVLRSAAKHVAGTLRQGVDWIARYGGEEFVLVLPETPLEAAIAIAHRLCDALPQHAVPNPRGGLGVQQRELRGHGLPAGRGCPCPALARRHPGLPGQVGRPATGGGWRLNAQVAQRAQSLPNQ